MFESIAPCMKHRRLPAACYIMYCTWSWPEHCQQVRVTHDCNRRVIDDISNHPGIDLPDW